MMLLADDGYRVANTFPLSRLPIDGVPDGSWVFAD